MKMMLHVKISQSYILWIKDSSEPRFRMDLFKIFSIILLFVLIVSVAVGQDDEPELEDDDRLAMDEDGTRK